VPRIKQETLIFPDEPAPKLRWVRSRAQLTAQGLDLVELLTLLRPAWNGSDVPWREGVKAELLQGTDGKPRAMYVPSTGESFDAFDIIRRLEGGTYRSATARYSSLSGVKVAGRKIGRGNAKLAGVGYLEFRFRQNGGGWIRFSEEWEEWSELCDKTRYRLVAALREEALAGNSPFLPLLVSHTFLKPCGTLGTRWEILVGDLRDPQLFQKLAKTQTCGRERHFRHTIRGVEFTHTEIRDMIDSHSKDWIASKEEAGPIPEAGASDGHCGGIGGKCFKKTPQDSNPIVGNGITDRTRAGYEMGSERQKTAAGLVKLIQACCRRLKDKHHENCKVNYSAHHAYRYAERCLRDGFAFDAVVSAYEQALFRHHGLATDAGMTFVPSGVIADAERLVRSEGNRFTPPTPMTSAERAEFERLARESLMQHAA